MMFYYPSNCGSKMCPYKDVLFQKERLKGNMIDNGVKTYCYSDGTLSPEIDKYPVIIYSHGLTGFQMESTVLCADLVTYTDKPILVLCSPLNHMAYFKLKKISYPHLSIKKIRKVTHWEFSDGVYLSDKGKSNRQWAYDVSSKRANLCLELLIHGFHLSSCNKEL